MKKLLITLALASTCAHAEFMDGNDLLNRLMDTAGTVNRAAGIGYVAGVFDSGMGVMHCAPVTVTLKQVSDVVRIALEASPTDRHKAADALVFRALGVAWPCAKKGSTL